jgi:zinc protease
LPIQAKDALYEHLSFTSWRGLDVLLTEAERVRQYGFTETELERQKQAVLRSMEKAYAERDKIESPSLAAEYIRNFLFAEPIPGIEYEYMLYRKFVPDITLEEINKLSKQWVRDESRVVTVESPEKEGIAIPVKENLEKIFLAVRQKSIEPYQDDVLDAPLMASIPAPKPVVSETYEEKLDVTKWELPNGATVIVKPTDFKNDEVRFSATSKGGFSLVDTEHLIPGQTASSVVSQGGLGDFNQIQLQKLLSDKVVRLNPYISELSEGFSGQASPKDLEALFQMIHLYFYRQRMDSSAFVSFKSRMQAYYQNRSLQPETAWRDTISVTLTQHHPRYRPISASSLEKMDLEKSFEIFADRFAEAGDFMFFFVGNFDKTQLKSLVETYLSNLPTKNRQESWKDVTYDFPKGVITKIVRKGQEPKSQNSIIFTGDFEWNRENRYKANSLIEVLRIKLRERIREDLGGTYGVRIRGSFPHIPKERYQVRIEFGSDPARVEELTDEIFTQIDSIVQFGTTETYLSKVKEAQIRGYETNMKENGFWINNLEFKYFHGEDPMDILTYPEMVEALSLEDIHTFAMKLLDKSNYLRVVLLPENINE